MEGRERETGDKGRREKGESGSMGRITGLEEIGYVPPKVRQMYGAVIELLEEGMDMEDILPAPKSRFSRSRLRQNSELLTTTLHWPQQNSRCFAGE